MAKEATLKIMLEAEDKASGTLSKASKALGGLAKAGKGMLIAGGIITTGFGLAIKSAANFESGMREVNTMMGLSQEEFKKMSDRVLALSTDIGVNAVESTQALYQAISAGVPKENAIEFLAIATKAAIGGVTDTATAVDGLTTVINAFKLPLSDAQKVADIMFATVKGGKTTFEELSASMFNVAPIAAASGISFEEVSAALATMTKQGVPTKQATTQLRQAMVALQKPTADMNKVINSLGYESGQAMVQELGFAESINRLRDATGGNNEMLMKMFGSVEAGGAILALTGENAKMLTADLEAMKSATEGVGAATEAFNEVNKGAGRQFEILKEKMQGVMITIGNALLPLITPLIEKMQKVIATVAKWIKENPALAGTILKIIAVLGALMTILGPILIMLPMITSALPILGAAFAALLGPVGWVIAAIAGVIAIGTLMVKHWDKIKNFFRNVWEKIKGFFKAAWDWIKEYGLYFLGLPGVVIKHWRNIVGFFQGIWEKIKGFFADSINWIIDKMNWLIKKINLLPGITIPTISRIGEAVKNQLGPIALAPIKTEPWAIKRISEVPGLASGGIVTRPTMVMAGERGPEIIAPLRQALGYNITYVTVQIGGEKVAEMVDKSLDRRKRIQQVV